jgi:hypothetical protein
MVPSTRTGERFPFQAAARLTRPAPKGGWSAITRAPRTNASHSGSGAA